MDTNDPEQQQQQQQQQPAGNEEDALMSPIPKKKKRPPTDDGVPLDTVGQNMDLPPRHKHGVPAASWHTSPSRPGGNSHHHHSNTASDADSGRKRSYVATTSGGNVSNKNFAQQRPPYPNPSAVPHSHIQLKSEHPLVLKIQTKGIPLTRGIRQLATNHNATTTTMTTNAGRRLQQQQRQPQPQSFRSTGRKKTVVHYQEASLTDSDDFLTDTDDDDDEEDEGNKRKSHKHRPAKKKRRVLHHLDSSSHNDSVMASTGITTHAAVLGTSPSRTPVTDGETAAVDPTLSFKDTATTDITATTASAAYPTEGLDAPPEGTLATLWYSREVFLQILVLEKVVGWKERPVVRLVHNVPASEAAATTTTSSSLQLHGTPYTLDVSEAQRWQIKALQTPRFWNDTASRMAISRAAPAQCPVVLQLAACHEARLAQSQGRSPRFVLASNIHNDNNINQHDSTTTTTTAMEEVLLVKWRGRSHWHCSWERAADIQKVDAGANNTAKQKIKRFYQSQETTYGPNWKRALQEDRDTAAAIHAHGEASVGAAAATAATTSNAGEEYFPIQCLELERILACDESEMHMNVLAIQRAKNKQDLRQEEEETTLLLDVNSQERITALLNAVLEAPEVNESWDPEDNVRYVVKWKGLPYAEMTWEYWRDIKRDAVDLAEDFWYRQQAPSVEEVRDAVTTTHPQIRDFKKLQESPIYGLSSRPRPVARLDDGGIDMTSHEDEEEETTFEGFRLRSYQLEGVNWLLFNWWNKRSCILADEMGLGKTIQSAAFIQQLQTNPSTKMRGPFLIVAPLSLVGQWQSELASWVPDMNTVLYHGSADAREFLINQEFYYNDPFVQKATAVKLKKQCITKFHVLITTYEVILKDTATLSKIKWRALIVDEAHRLKNHKSRLFAELAAVPRDYCVLLTGTPIANATEELFSLLHFANPKIFDDRDSFMDKFGQMTDAKQVNELHSLLRPYLLRRVKEDVEKSLPPKEETILEVSLTPIQKAYYKAIYERNTAFLFKGAKVGNAPSLMNVMMELRKCCNHPFLVKGAEERILTDAAGRAAEKVKQDATFTIPDPHELFADQLVKSSGKMVLMEKLLQKLFAGDHKVLIFSQMVRVLDLLEELLKIKRYKYERLDGSTSSSSRLAAVERFKRKSCQRFVMLLSTRAGGLGLNLTAADVVVIFDSDWNPQNDLQAMARAHRIGQQRSVKIYRLLTAKTYEMHMFHSASLKLGLERAVLSQNRDQSDDGDESKTRKKSDREAQAKEIDELLKKGAYDVFRDDDDAEAEKFMETDIDQLLENSSKKVTYGASSTNSLGSGLGSFSKASFVADTGSGEKDVDLDDPDFWAKAVGLDAPVETPEEVAAMLDDGVKRSRKQVQVYDPYAETAEAEQRKKEKIAMEKLLEKEEKERAKHEKKKKKEAEKKKKQREKEEQKQQLAEKKAVGAVSTKPIKVAAKEETKKVTPSSVSSANLEVVRGPKKSKKSDRQRALRRTENENPILEQLRQAWEAPHRNRASAAILRFGFARFCKVRNEANLNSLPLQDIEVFTRALIYQAALQAATSIIELSRKSVTQDLRLQLSQWLGGLSKYEISWIASSMISAMEHQKEVEEKRRFLRLPVIVCEPSYMSDLKNGGALRFIRRLGVLSRLNAFVEKCLDTVLSGLGHEELGKRGCASGDLDSLDVDLKARFVTTEELSLVISTNFTRLLSTPPAVWWDRHCDVALIVGTFIHGFGNYASIRSDPELPFADKIKRSATLGSLTSNQAFLIAASAARDVFDDALEAGRVKAELEVQAAVAAAAKAASKREEDAALLREGGDGVEDVIKNMPETQVENAFEFDGTDSHFVTLKRLHTGVREAVAKNADKILNLTAVQETSNANTTGRPKNQIVVSMPDSRVLDHRLLEILAVIEEPDAHLEYRVEESLLCPESQMADLYRLRRNVLSRFYGRRTNHFLREYAGVGLAASQCGTTHRTLNDGTDYGYGSASPMLSQVAYGTDAPRYLRALGVPMNITRFAVSALAYADGHCADQVLSLERQKCLKRQKDVLPKFLSESTTSEESFASEGKRGDNPAACEHSDQAGHQTSHSNIVKDEYEDSVCNDGDLLVPEEFRDNAMLRGVICLGILMYGYPKPRGCTDVEPSILALLRSDSSPKVSCFDPEKFRESVESFCHDIQLPPATMISEYVESSLLPHCLRLCLHGNGETTEARGSQGEYKTALGVSLHPSPSEDLPCPLPDPCIDRRLHSLEALGIANAILRRTQLLSTAQVLCNGTMVTATQISEAAHCKLLDSPDNLPVWWCPRVHDIGLMIRAATNGLFSILEDREGDTIFSKSAIMTFLKNSIDSQPFPFFGRSSSPDAVEDWIHYESGKFPTLLQLERRLAFLCGQASANAPDLDDRFVVLPMFDHGGWPRD